jgi:hypothetical protein
LSIEVLVPVIAGNQNLRLHKKVKINFGRSMVNGVASDQSRKDDLWSVSSLWVNTGRIEHLYRDPNKEDARLFVHFEARPSRHER